jgi:hypothetical protein
LLIVMSKAYCVKCRTKTEIVDTEEEIISDGRRAVKGRCAVCEEPVLKMECFDHSERLTFHPESGNGVQVTKIAGTQDNRSNPESPSMVRIATLGLQRLCNQTRSWSWPHRAQLVNGAGSSSILKTLPSASPPTS